MKKNKLIKIAFIHVLLIAFVATVNAEVPSCDSIVDKNLRTNHASVKLMIRDFCSSTYGKKCVGPNADLDYFDANQSVFLSILCDNVNKGSEYTSITRGGENSFLKKNDFYDFGIVEANNSGGVCNYKENTMNACDLSKHLSNIFNQIINDCFNIAQTRIYGITNAGESINLELVANKFSADHFLGLEICSDSTHKKTCKYLKNYISKASRLLNKTNVLNVKNIVKAKQKIDCSNRASDNILYCGLFSQTNYEINFNNLVYNEYLWYSLFMTYYSKNLEVNEKISSIEGSPSDKLADNGEKIYQVQKQLYNIKDGLSLSIRRLSEISGTFPVHIGMTMYQEDANLFMKEFAKIYAPIRTLYDKLRNVQEK